MKRIHIETLSCDDILYLVHKFLFEQGFHEAATTTALAIDPGFRDLEPCVIEGDWTETENYFRSIGMSIEDDLTVAQYIYEIRKQNLLEEMMTNSPKANEVLNDIRGMKIPKERIDEDLKEIQDFVNQTPSLSDPDGTISKSRACLWDKLMTMGSEDPLFDKDKKFRHLELSSLWQLVDKSHVLGCLRNDCDRHQISTNKIRLKSGKTKEKNIKCNFPGGNIASSTDLPCGSLTTSAIMVNDRHRISTNKSRLKEHDTNPETQGKKKEKNIMCAFPGGDIASSTDLLCGRLTRSAIMDNQSVVRLLYTNSGETMIALLSNGVHVVWIWRRKKENPQGLASIKVRAELMDPPFGSITDDEIIDTQSCRVELSENDTLVYSSSATKISVFNLASSELVFEISSSPRGTPCFTLLDDDAVAIGNADFTIEIFLLFESLSTKVLHGHTQRITCLAYFPKYRWLASSGADNQIIIWDSIDWEIMGRALLDIPFDWSTASSSNPQVYFHQDGNHLLVSHESQLVIYDTSDLQVATFQWIVNPHSAPINNATFSCQFRMIYSTFLDGTIRVFMVDEKCTRVQSICRIKPSGYYPSYSIDHVSLYPTSLAAHPLIEDQFAVGLSNGDVILLEPVHSWGDFTTIVCDQAKPSTSLDVNDLFC